MAEPIWMMALGAILLAAALFDIARLRIPNAISLALVLLFVLRAVLVLPPSDWLGHLIAGSTVLFGGFVLFALGLLGGGDVKLLAATALWLGPATTLPLLAITGIAGGVLAVAILVVRLALRPWLRLHAEERLVQLPRAFVPGAPVPYGVAIAFATLYLQLA